MCNGHSCVPIKIYLQKTGSRLTWPVGCSVLTPVLGKPPKVKTVTERPTFFPHEDINCELISNGEIFKSYLKEKF